MTVFVRQARPEDAETFAKWFAMMPSFGGDIFQFPETYTLCAFVKGKIIGFLVVHCGFGIQVLNRFVSNPEASDLQKASASRELVKHAITLGYLNNLTEILFVGDNTGTNRIAEHIFEKVDNSEYQEFLGETDYPVYRVKLRNLE